MKKHFLLNFTLIAIVLTLSTCSKINIFSIEDDKQLGLQVKQEIESNPTEYPILSRTSYPAPYAYLENMKQEILNSGQVTHKDDFTWELYIIKDDNVQNAFCTPGGYIYIYSGLIKYLDNASSLAGVMGHEMGHADKRHSTNAMTEQYGLQTLLDIVLGKNQGQLTQIAASLVTLKFSRANETEADKMSVTYLCPTKYHSNGAADFFRKIIASGASQPPAFLSTHPNPDNRVANIDAKSTELGCTSSINSTDDITNYNAFKNSLP